MKAIVRENTDSLAGAVIVDSHAVRIGGTDTAVGFPVMSTDRFH